MKTVAVIGCGKAQKGKEGFAIGHQHANGYLTCGHEVRLLGVDVSAENLEAFGGKFGLGPDQLFSSTDALYDAVVPDVVSICTWPALHHPMCLEAMDKGVKGIACEKPLAMDAGQIRDIENKAAKTGTKIAVAHQRRYQGFADGFKQVLADGMLGENLQVMARVGDGWDILSWTTHWFDMANFLFDGAPDYVMAGMDIHETRRYKHAVEDASVIFADYGQRGTAIFLTGPGRTTDFTLRGNRGIAVLNGKQITCATVDGVHHIPLPVQERSDFGMYLGGLIDWIDGGQESRCSLARSAVATEMAYAAHESARTGKIVHLPLDVLYAPLEVVQAPVRSALWGRNLLLYADAHFGSGGREGIMGAFRDLTGKDIRTVDAAARGLASEDLDGIEAVMLYHTQKEVDDVTRELLEGWVTSGKPLLIVHAGLGAWPKWERYQTWCGRVWEWNVSYHPHEAAALTPTPGDPLRFGWHSGWLPRDEVFVALKDSAEVEVGLQAEISTGVFPAAWRNSRQKNVGVWMPGHRRDSWNIPAMRSGVSRTLLSLFNGAAGADRENRK